MPFHDLFTPGNSMEDSIAERRRKMIQSDPNFTPPPLISGVVPAISPPSSPAQVELSTVQEDQEEAARDNPIGAIIDQLFKDMQERREKEGAKKPVGPDLFGKGSGLLGSGIDLSEVALGAIGAGLSSNLPPEQAMNVTLALANLPRKIDERRRNVGGESVKEIISLVTAATQAENARLRGEELRETAETRREKREKDVRVEARREELTEDFTDAVVAKDPEAMFKARARLQILLGESKTPDFPSVGGSFLPPGFDIKDFDVEHRMAMADAVQRNDLRPDGTVNIDNIRKGVVAAKVARAKAEIEYEAESKEGARLKALRDPDRKLNLGEAVTLKHIDKDDARVLMGANSLINELENTADVLETTFKGQDEIISTFKSMVIQSNFSRTMFDLFQSRGETAKWLSDKGFEITDKQKDAVFLLVSQARNARLLMTAGAKATIGFSTAERQVAESLLGLGFNTIDDTVLRLRSLSGQIRRGQNERVRQLPASIDPRFVRPAEREPLPGEEIEVSPGDLSRVQEEVRKMRAGEEAERERITPSESLIDPDLPPEESTVQPTSEQVKTILERVQQRLRSPEFTEPPPPAVDPTPRFFSEPGPEPAPGGINETLRRIQESLGTARRLREESEAELEKALRGR